MNSNEEKPFIVTYWGKEMQLDTAEKDTLVQAVKDENKYVFLKDGRVLSTKFQSLEPNIRYISPESVIRTRKKKELWNEFQDLKKQGVLVTKKEFFEYKKKRIKEMKKYQESLKENEKE